MRRRLPGASRLYAGGPQSRNPMAVDADLPVPSLSGPVLDCIERRASTRKFAPEPVTDEADDGAIGRGL